MPTYRSIQISLKSQFDALSIPEYPPHPLPPDPFTTSPPPVDESTATTNVYIPIYPSSQFWVAYNITPPHPPGILYYFKLFVNGTCVVSWGCGKEDGFKGYTMFALFAAPGGRGVEKRVLAYASVAEGEQSTEMSGDFFEVKVYRSKGRKRVLTPEPATYQAASTPKPPRKLKTSESGISQKMARGPGDGIDLINAGTLPRDHPRRYYQYHLLDALDEPFATFRYHYRTWAQLDELGVLSSSAASSGSGDSDSIFLRDMAAWIGGVDERAAEKEAGKTTSSSSSGLLADDSPRTEQHTPVTSPTPDGSETAHLPARKSSILTLPDSQQIHDDTRTIPLPTASPIPPNPASSPQTPPPSNQPSLPQGTLLHKTSKESFASLIRHPPNAPSSLNLTTLSATIEKTSSLPHSRSRPRSSSPLTLPWSKRLTEPYREDDNWARGRKSFTALRNVLTFKNTLAKTSSPPPRFRERGPGIDDTTTSSPESGGGSTNSSSGSKRHDSDVDVDITSNMLQEATEHAG